MHPRRSASSYRRRANCRLPGDRRDHEVAGATRVSTSGDAPGFAAVRDAKLSEARADMCERARQQRDVVALVNPAARARGMRQRNRHRRPSQVLDLVLAPDELFQRETWQKALDRQSPDGNQHPRTHEPKLIVQPGRAVRALGWRRYAIAAAARTRARITACNRCDVDAPARCFLVQSDLRQPTKKRVASSSGKRATSRALDLSGCLPNEHDLRPARERDDWPDGGAMRATPARSECSAVILQLAIQPIRSLHQLVRALTKL